MQEFALQRWIVVTSKQLLKSLMQIRRQFAIGAEEIRNSGLNLSVAVGETF